MAADAVESMAGPLLALFLVTGGRLRLEFAGDGVEDSVDELDGLGGGEAAGDLQRFVDDDGARGFGEAEEFGYAGAQDVAIDGCHALQAPVLGVALEELADLVVALHGDAEDVVGEVADAVLEIAALSPESFLDVLDGLLAHVRLEEHLQR